MTLSANRQQRPWLPREDAQLSALYATHSARAVALMLNRTKSSIKNRACVLNLQKGHNNPGRFLPGSTPWNKGTHYVSGGNSVLTQFKKGQHPHSWRPIGHTRTRSDEYMERKTADTGNTRHDYVLIHHLVWRMHGHSIPRGQVLVFRDGDRRNFDINNLQLIKRQELMQRNSVHNLPAEVKELVSIKARIVRKINQMEKYHD